MKRVSLHQNNTIQHKTKNKTKKLGSIQSHETFFSDMPYRFWPKKKK